MLTNKRIRTTPTALTLDNIFSNKAHKSLLKCDPTSFMRSGFKFKKQKRKKKIGLMLSPEEPFNLLVSCTHAFSKTLSNILRTVPCRSFILQNHNTKDQYYMLPVLTCRGAAKFPSSSSSGIASPLRSRSEDLFHSGVGGQMTISGFLS